MNFDWAEAIKAGAIFVFFLSLGVELRHEIRHGSLAKPRQAIVPIFAAVGGMLVPVLIYSAINSGLPTSVGWGVPMSTDVAFALAVLALAAVVALLLVYQLWWTNVQSASAADATREELVADWSPPAVVAKLHQAFAAALNAPETKTRFGLMMAEPVVSTPEQFSAFMKRELAKYEPVVKATGARVD